MLMMGLKQWVLWSTWYLKQFLFLMLPVIVICILLKVPQIYSCYHGKET
jgi:ATP-binding cassette subfamily A (ABC1) protein 3